MNIYLVTITLSMGLTYYILLAVYAYFFEKRLPLLTQKSLVSIALIILFSIISLVITLMITDPWWSNRFLHAVGGGFLAFLVCFLAAKDAQVSISKFQFFIFSMLTVTSLGVVNEIAESFLQNYTHFVFATEINDTWLDLISNTIGAFFAAICFVPLLKTKS